jgi:hypothetical protein
LGNRKVGRVEVPIVMAQVAHRASLLSRTTAGISSSGTSTCSVTPPAGTLPGGATAKAPFAATVEVACSVTGSAGAALAGDGGSSLFPLPGWEAPAWEDRGT